MRKEELIRPIYKAWGRGQIKSLVDIWEFKPKGNLSAACSALGKNYHTLREDFEKPEELSETSILTLHRATSIPFVAILKLVGRAIDGSTEPIEEEEWWPMRTGALITRMDDRAYDWFTLFGQGANGPTMAFQAIQKLAEEAKQPFAVLAEAIVDAVHGQQNPDEAPIADEFRGLNERRKSGNLTFRQIFDVITPDVIQATLELHPKMLNRRLADPGRFTLRNLSYLAMLSGIPPKALASMLVRAIEGQKSGQ
jgi:hypothetical protein